MRLDLWMVAGTVGVLAFAPLALGDGVGDDAGEPDVLLPPVVLAPRHAIRPASLQEANEPPAMQPGPGPAQPTPPDETPQGCPAPAAQSRTLTDHVFTYGTLVVPPMMGSTFGMRFSTQFVRIPGYPAGQYGPLNVNDLQAQTSADLTLSIIDRFGLFVSATAAGTTGTNSNSLLGNGLSYQYDTNGGLLFGLVHDRRTGNLLTLRGEIGYGEGRQIQPGQLAAQVEQNPSAAVQNILVSPGAVLLTPTHTLHYGGHLAWGHAFGSAFDMQAALGAIEYEESAQPFQISGNLRTNVQNRDFAPDAAIGFTLGGAAGFPLALQAEYRITLGWLDSSFQHPQQDADLGLYYSGRTDLQLGVAVLGSWLPQLQGTDVTGATAHSGLPQAVGGEFVFRYVW